MVRRRRGFKGTWLPALGTSGGDNDEINVTGIAKAITIENTDLVNTNIIALIPDEEATEINDASVSLVSAIGNEYALRRIVGKFNCYLSTTSGAPDQTAVKIGLGFFIARETPGQEGIPLGIANDTFDAANNVEAFDSFSPLALAATRQPWIWRRTWYLYESATNALFPQVTSNYGSVLDGPHIDAKTRRRVRQEERLYAAVSIQYAQLATNEDAGSITCQYDLDVRCFGALRKARNRSAF